VLFEGLVVRLLEKKPSRRFAASNTPAFSNTIKHSPLGWRITMALVPEETP